MKLPAWLKILLIIFLASFVFTVLGAVSPYVIGPVLVLALIFFPGRDPERPTLVKVIPWFWALEVLASVFFLAAQWTGRQAGLSDDVRPPTAPELWASIVLGIPLIWSLAKRSRTFRPLLIVSTAVFIAISIWAYADAGGDFKAKLELAGSLVTQLMVTIYLLMKVRPHESELAQEQNDK